MPDTVNRQSLTTNLETRYSKQRAGGAFEVKDVLEQPNKAPAAGTVYDAKSANGQGFQSPNGFQFKMATMMSQLIEAQTAGKSGISTYARNLNTTPYKR